MIHYAGYYWKAIYDPNANGGNGNVTHWGFVLEILLMAVFTVLSFLPMRIKPGHVRVRPTERDLVFPDDPIGAQAALVASGAGIRAQTDPDFTTAAWLKLLTNAAANPITALTGRRIEVLKDPAVVPFALQVLEEASSVGRAEGARISGGAPRERLDWLQNLQEGSTTSMLQDRSAGLETEHDGLTGAIVQLASRHGVKRRLRHP